MRIYILHTEDDRLIYTTKEDAQQGQSIFGGVIVEVQKNIFHNNKGELVYVDKNGDQIHEGDTLRFEFGAVRKVYLTDEGCLGTDATNPDWIKSGRAVPCEFGIYPLEEDDLRGAELVGDDI